MRTIHRLARWALGGIAVLMGAVLLLVAGVYVWPLGSASLRTADRTTRTYPQAVADIVGVVQAENSGVSLLPGCGTKLFVHGARTARAVLLLHGLTECTQQFDGLAREFYRRGYNVYVPRMPTHGTTQDSSAYSTLTPQQFVDFANAALTATSGLGQDVGVVGISGGAVLATWLAEYRPDVVAHLEVLSPLYRPARTRVPPWQLKPLSVVYGNKLVPDQFTEPGRQGGFSYYSVAEMMRIVANYPNDLGRAGLKTLALVTSDLDPWIDLPGAREFGARLARANSDATYHDYRIPPAWKVQHDSADEKTLDGHASTLFRIYADLYEGSLTDSRQNA